MMLKIYIIFLLINLCMGLRMVYFSKNKEDMLIWLIGGMLPLINILLAVIGVFIVWDTFPHKRISEPGRI